MAENVIIPSSNVQGDITSCKIEQQLFKVDKSSIFSIQQYNTYISYDVCNKEILSQYQVPEWTGFGFFLGIFIGAFILIIILAFTDRY